MPWSMTACGSQCRSAMLPAAAADNLGFGIPDIKAPRLFLVAFAIHHCCGMHHFHHSGVVDDCHSLVSRFWFAWHNCGGSLCQKWPCCCSWHCRTQPLYAASLKYLPLRQSPNRCCCLGCHRHFHACAYPYAWAPLLPLPTRLPRPCPQYVTQAHMSSSSQRSPLQCHDQL